QQYDFLRSNFPDFVKELRSCSLSRQHDHVSFPTSFFDAVYYFHIKMGGEMESRYTETTFFHQQDPKLAGQLAKSFFPQIYATNPLKSLLHNLFFFSVTKLVE